MQEFGQLIAMFSSEKDVSISQIKQNIYTAIVNGRWWNLEAYFANLTSALEDKDKETTDSMTKGEKIEYQN